MTLGHYHKIASHFMSYSQGRLKLESNAITTPLCALFDNPSYSFVQDSIIAARRASLIIIFCVLLHYAPEFFKM